MISYCVIRRVDKYHPFFMNVNFKTELVQHVFDEFGWDMNDGNGHFVARGIVNHIIGQMDNKGMANDESIIVGFVNPISWTAHRARLTYTDNVGVKTIEIGSLYDATDNVTYFEAAIV